MTQAIPCLCVYRNKVTGEFLVQHDAPHHEYDFPVAVGPMDRCSDQMMKDQGIAIVLESLRGFATRPDSDPSDLELMSKEKQKRFESEHTCVMINLEKDGKIGLAPMVRGKRGGFIDNPQGVVTVPTSIGPAEFYSVLTNAMTYCSS